MTKNPWLVFRLKLEISKQKFEIVWQAFFSYYENVWHFHSMEKVLIIQFRIFVSKFRVSTETLTKDFLSWDNPELIIQFVIHFHSMEKMLVIHFQIWKKCLFCYFHTYTFTLWNCMKEYDKHFLPTSELLSAMFWLIIKKRIDWKRCWIRIQWTYFFEIKQV